MDGGSGERVRGGLPHLQAAFGSGQHKQNPLLPQSDASVLVSPTVIVKRQMAQFLSSFPACYEMI